MFKKYWLFGLVLLIFIVACSPVNAAEIEPTAANTNSAKSDVDFPTAIPSEAQTVDDKELKTYLKTCLSAFKVPKEYRIVDQLPKSSTGKILKRVLRKGLLEQVAREE